MYISYLKFESLICSPSRFWLVRYFAKYWSMIVFSVSRGTSARLEKTTLRKNLDLRETMGSKASVNLLRALCRQYSKPVIRSKLNIVIRNKKDFGIFSFNFSLSLFLWLSSFRLEKVPRMSEVCEQKVSHCSFW